MLKVPESSVKLRWRKESDLMLKGDLFLKFPSPSVLCGKKAGLIARFAALEGSFYVCTDSWDGLIMRICK